MGATAEKIRMSIGVEKGPPPQNENEGSSLWAFQALCRVRAGLETRTK